MSEPGRRAHSVHIGPMAEADAIRLAEAIERGGLAAERLIVVGEDYRTRTGRVLSDRDLDTLAEEAAAREHPFPQDTVWEVPGGQVRLLPRQEDDYSDVYVLDVLGLTVLVRERETDTFIHVDADGMDELRKRPLMVEVFNGGENPYGEPDEYCDDCGQQLTRDGEVLDGDGYDGLCGNCADKAEAQGRWSR